MSCEKENFRTIFLYFRLNDMSSLPQNWQILIFYCSSPFEREVIFKVPLFDSTY